MNTFTVIAYLSLLLVSSFAHDHDHDHDHDDVHREDHNDDHVGYWFTMRVNTLVGGTTVATAKSAVEEYIEALIESTVKL